MNRLYRAFRKNCCKVIPLLLLLVGALGLANASVSPTSLSCPSTKEGSSQSCGSVTVSGAGTIESVTSSTASFLVNSGTCTSGTTTSPCTFSVSFKPNATGSLSATVTVTSEVYNCSHGGPCEWLTHTATVGVSGTGLVPYTYSWYASGWGACTGGTGTWNYGAWSAPNSYCSVNATETRSTTSCVANADTGSQNQIVYCRRSDGTQVANSYCSGSAPASSQACTPTSGYSCGTPVTSQTVSSLTGCQYNWIQGTWSACTGASAAWSYTAWSPAASSACTASLTQTRSGTCNIVQGSGSQTETPTCQRSDNTIVPNSDCPAASEPPTTQACTPTSNSVCGQESLTRTITDAYSGCTYNWQASGFGACVGGTGTWNYTPWSPTCGTGTFTQTRSGSCSPNASSATQTQTVTCVRSDGTTEPSSDCSSSTEPAASQACTPSSGYACGTEGALNQQVTMNTVCMAAMTACVPDPAKNIYCITLPLK